MHVISWLWFQKKNCNFTIIGSQDFKVIWLNFDYETFKVLDGLMENSILAQRRSSLLHEFFDMCDIQNTSNQLVIDENENYWSLFTLKVYM